MPNRVLLVVDLEGLPGVDRLDALAIGGEGHAHALHCMHEATRAAITELRELGLAGPIRISDAHRSGAPFNLRSERLPEDCELHFTDDMYGGALLDDVQAVVCIGMHASAQSGGFAGHTVSLQTGWWLGDERLNETTIAQYLAAERGVPVWVTSGDDVLAREVSGRVRCVVTKDSRSVSETTSRATTGRLLETRNLLVPTVPRVPLKLRFQTRAEAQAAGTTVIPALGSFQEQYDAALKVIARSEDALATRLEGALGTREFARSVAHAFLTPWDAP